jgi:hypothetical protein
MVQRANSSRLESINLKFHSKLYLEVTDFAEDREIKDQIRLWDSQIDQLKHCLGAA